MRRSSSSAILVIILIVLLISGSFPANPLQAQTNPCIVSSSADTGAIGTLRNAITNPTCPSITFSITGATITVTYPLLIQRSVTIVGSGTGNLTISGNNSTKVLSITAPSGSPGIAVNISHLAIAQGHDTTDWGGNIHQNNGGGTLTLTDCIIQDGYANNGGGIYNEWGTLEIHLSRFINNKAETSLLPTDGYGGAIYNRTYTIANIDGSEFSSNSTVDSTLVGTITPAITGGGAIWNAGTLTIANSSFNNNQANTTR